MQYDVEQFGCAPIVAITDKQHHVCDANDAKPLVPAIGAHGEQRASIIALEVGVCYVGAPARKMVADSAARHVVP